MGKITIDYSEIKSAAKKAKSVSGYYEDFADELEKKVSKKLTNLPGSDGSGHIGNAQSVVSKKIKELRNNKSYYSKLNTALTNLAEEIEFQEKSVVTDVRYVATEALELNRQSKWQAFCQWAYGTFCVDLMNSNPITRFIGNGIKKSLDWVQEKGTKIVNWFKHGEGKYVLGIVLDVAACIGAICATVAAIALAIGTGGAATPLVVAAVASTIGTVMTLIDSGFSIYNKSKALKIQNETGDPGRARYYGNIGGVNDTIKKTDMGGETANDVWGVVGTGYDVVHVAADVTAFVAGSYGQAGLSHNYVRDANGKIISVNYSYDPTKAKSNIKNIMLDKIGVNKRNGKWKFDPKRLIMKSDDIKTGPAYAAEKYVSNIQKRTLGGFNKPLKTVQKVTGFPKKVYKQITNWETITSSKEGWYDKTKSVLDLASSTDYQISKPIDDFNSTVVTIIDTIVDIAS